MSPILHDIANQLAAHGLMLRGGFAFDDATPAPVLAPLPYAARDASPLAVALEAAGPGVEQTSQDLGFSPSQSGGELSRRSRDGEGVVVGPRSVLLVGQAGAAPWPHFSRWRRTQPAGLQNPLDTWSREVIGAVADRFGARAVSPSDRPYLPFQQWAMRAEGLKPSPLGILMHPTFGLWHAYRGALLFDAEIAVEPPRAVTHLCDLCQGKPCLKACPVGAHSTGGFAYQACLDHVRGADGQPCRVQGCLDRNACPYGTAYRYPAEAQAFHMAAFAR